MLVAKNRGGLTAVNDEGQKLFLGIEKKFRTLLNSRSIASINIKDEVENFAVDPFVVNYFNQIVDIFDLKPGSQNKQRTLFMILELYFTIRTNSLTKDLKHTDTSLRKNMKKANTQLA